MLDSCEGYLLEAAAASSCQDLAKVPLQLPHALHEQGAHGPQRWLVRVPEGPEDGRTAAELWEVELARLPEAGPVREWHRALPTRAGRDAPLIQMAGSIEAACGLGQGDCQRETAGSRPGGRGPTTACLIPAALAKGDALQNLGANQHELWNVYCWWLTPWTLKLHRVPIQEVQDHGVCTVGLLQHVHQQASGLSQVHEPVLPPWGCLHSEKLISVQPRGRHLGPARAPIQGAAP
mmetsp:Transcript_1694/g.5280  ORF Transcript_1694/g.5280 Transcript_1694/m.5280 type:complete len:235 (+) Transcript_1694:500-1204(+)